MKLKVISASAMVLAVCLSVMAMPKPDFSGAWVMDRGRSFGLPGNMQQTMTVTQTENQLEVETKLIQPGNERTVKDVFVFDGKEHEFTPPTPPNAPPAKGKRTSNWLPDGSAMVLNEVVTTETPKGTVTTQITKKWKVNAAGELTIDLYVDGPNGSYEAKRIFIRK
ncbi:MAG TPA: hypothetical protein VGW76_12275 [Pyrinomonadaceae bacterium]|nr:hypothetical protein [Pyrinomonadaceae bacterium]